MPRGDDTTVTISDGHGEPVTMTGDQLHRVAEAFSLRRNRDIRKVSWDGERVLVKWEVMQPKGVDEFQLSCVDAPATDLLDALAALRPRVAEICQLPEEYCASMEIRGVSFSYGGEGRVMGATITALKPLATANAPLVVNTPHLASESYSEDGPTDKLLSTAAIVALEAVMVEALRYIDGHRAQRDLFSEK